MFRSHDKFYAVVPRTSRLISTVLSGEVEKFSRIKNEWWNHKSTVGVAPLHMMNFMRVKYIAEAVSNQKNNLKPLSGLNCLDIGCGGGLLSESLARLGGNILGIDPSPENVNVAAAHSKIDPLTRSITYKVCTAEELDQGTEKFDLVCAMEVVEHVADVSEFVRAAAALVRPRGNLVMSTINRTAKSYAVAVIGAEIVTRIIPYGTHDWNKFITPRELMAKLRTHGLQVRDSSGIVLNPCTLKFELSNTDLDVNYIVVAQKPESF